MPLEDLIEGTWRLVKKPYEILVSKKNRRAIFSFGAAFSISLATAACLSGYLKHENLPDFSNVAITFLVRNAAYFSIYIPLHRRLHRRDYLERTRDEKKEIGAISLGSAIGAVSNLILQPSFHYIGLHSLNIEPKLATIGAYILGGGISTYINGAILYRNKVLR